MIIDDDLGLGYIDDYKIVCYCPHCKAEFRQRYGYEIPSAETYATLKPAIVPDDHPWLNFYDFRTRQLPGYLSALAQHVRSISHPDTVVVTQQIQGVDPYPGCNLDHWTDWQDVINLHSYPHGSSPSTTAFAVDLWRQGDVLRRPAPPRPTWLMVQASWGSHLPPPNSLWPLPYVTAQIHMAMASGVQSIGLFTYNGSPTNSAVYDDEWFDALGDVLGQIKQLAGLWMVASASQKRIALLNSFTTDAFMSTRGLEPGLWYQFHIGEQAHAALLRAHVPTEVIGEEAIRRGRLDDYQALVLAHCHFLPESVADKITAYIDGGGIVYCDRDTSVPLGGLTRLPFVFTHHRDQCVNVWAGTGYRDSRVWEPHVRDQAQQLANVLSAVDGWYRVEDVDTIARSLDIPGARLLYLVNSSIQNYGKAAEDRVDPIVVTPTITVSSASSVYDLLAHKRVAVEDSDPGATWTVSIPGGGGAIFLVADQPLGPLKINAASTIAVDNHLDVTVVVRTGDGADLWPGTVPLDIQLTDSRGHQVKFGGAVAAVRGIWRSSLRIARNAPVGDWALQITNLANGETSTARVKVTKP